jgi:amidase
MTASAPDPHGPSAQFVRLGAAELGRLFADGSTTSGEVTSALLERVEAVDRTGPALRSVLRLNERALEEATGLDDERRRGRVRGPLHGVPILVKDNIDTADLGATAGSLALAGSSPPSDAHLVTKLRHAGMVIIGKANLSEWANFRGRPSSSGWSAAGGQTRNPFALNRTPGGSSAGSAAGVAAGLAPFAVGTETDGSILCPAAACGLVGLKPTVGLVSRTGIIPISASQDTAGPMARSVADVAMLLEVLAGGRADPDDRAMDGRRSPVGGYLRALASDLRGVRIGVVREEGYFGYHKASDRIVESAVAAMQVAGAEVVDPVTGIGSPVQADEMVVLCTEFKAGLDMYLARRSSGAGSSGAGPVGSQPFPRTLADVIAFNEESTGERLDVFPQDVLERAAATTGLDDDAYRQARRRNHERTRSDGIDGVCSRLYLDALVALTMAPAWTIDHVNGDGHFGSSWGQAAVAGYPSLSLPVGEVAGMPVGLTIWGPAWTEATLLRIAAAAEREIGYRPVPAYREVVAVLG